MPRVDDINTSMKPNQRFLFSDLLTDDEINPPILASMWIMVKTVIALMAEIGPRPGEFLTM